MDFDSLNLRFTPRTETTEDGKFLIVITPEINCEIFENLDWDQIDDDELEYEIPMVYKVKINHLDNGNISVVENLHISKNQGLAHVTDNVTSTNTDNISRASSITSNEECLIEQYLNNVDLLPTIDKETMTKLRRPRLSEYNNDAPKLNIDNFNETCNLKVDPERLTDIEKYFDSKRTKPLKFEINRLEMSLQNVLPERDEFPKIREYSKANQYVTPHKKNSFNGWDYLSGDNKTIQRSETSSIRTFDTERCLRPNVGIEFFDYENVSFLEYIVNSM